MHLTDIYFPETMQHHLVPKFHKHSLEYDQLPKN